MIGKRIVIPTGRYIVPKLLSFALLSFTYEILHSTPGYTGLCFLKYCCNTSTIVIPVEVKYNHDKFSVDMMIIEM